MEPKENQVARLRRIGLIVLIAGTVIGGLIYLLVPSEAQPDENTLASQYYKRDERAAQGLWGNGGSAVLWLTRSLKQPGTYSVIVIAASAIFALICFYLASRATQQQGQ